MAMYRYLVADLLSPFELRDEIPFSNCNYNHTLNGAGEFSASVPIGHPKTNRFNLDAGRTAVFIERDNTLVWGGSLEGVRKQGSSLQLSGKGFWHRLAQRRRIRTTKTYTGSDQFFIAQDLLNYAQSVADGNLGVIVGSNTCGVARDRAYPGYERKPIGEAIEQLAAVSNGFDFAVDVYYAGTPQAPTMAFTSSYPQRGRITELVFEQGKNLETFGYTIDATRQARTVDNLGAGDGVTMLIETATDTTMAGLYPQADDVISNKDVIVSGTLLAQAEAALAQELTPVFLPTATIQSTLDAPVGSWITGDHVTLRADDDYVAVNDYFRIMAWSANVDQDGTETITLEYAPVELFV